MSHFLVLVATEDLSIEEALQPYHDFESTGIDDEYVQNLDVLEEFRQRYVTSSILRYISPDGILEHPYNNKFYRDATKEELEVMNNNKELHHRVKPIQIDHDKIIKAKVPYLPDGYREEISYLKDELSFAEYLNDFSNLKQISEDDPIDSECMYGWFRVNDKNVVTEVIIRTNPNKIWDWWSIGGRFRETLYSKVTCNWTSCAKKADIDWEYMEKENKKPFLPFGLITKDGYISKGDIGWFGEEHNVDENWKQRFEDKLRTVPDNFYLTVVDCHI